MAETANELLGGILVTLKSIESKSGGATGAGGGEKSDGAKSMVSSVLASFMKVKPAERKVATSFLSEIVKIANSVKKDGMDAFVGGINGLSQSLPKLSESLKSLSSIKQRQINTVISVLRSLTNFIVEVGRKTVSIKKGTDVLKDIGKSLKDIAKPLDILSTFLMKFGLSLIVFAGGLVIASMILGAGGDVWKGIVLVIGILAAFVGVMWLIGKAGPAVEKGSDVLRNMGIGLLALPVALVLFSLALVAIPKILGKSGNLDGLGTTMLVIGGIILGSVLTMAFIGLFETQVRKGAGVMMAVAIGIMILAGAAVVVALAAKAISVIAGLGGGMDKDKKQSLLGMDVPPFVFGLGTLGLILLGGIALIAFFSATSAFLLPGIGIAIGFAISLIALAWSVKEVVKIANELKGEDISGNIETMISGTMLGFIGGVTKGLGIRKPTGAFDALALGIEVAAKVAVIIAGIGLVSGIAVTLSLFALSLRAFSKVGSIAPITGHDAEGNPIYGQAVTVADVAANIANSLSIFFTTMGDLFGPGGKANIDPDKMNAIVTALMGSGGFSLLGVPIIRTGPNLIDALYGFGDVLSFWGKMGKEGKISLGTDKDGKPLPGPKVDEVARTIAETLSIFMTSLSTGVLSLNTGEMAEKATAVSYILLGKKQSGLLGLIGKAYGIVSDRPGILEPVSKFGEVIQQFASGQYIEGYDSDGKPIYKPIDYALTADRIVKGIQDFTKSLADGLTKTDSASYDYAAGAKKAGSFLENFEDLFSGLEKLSSAQDGLQQLATTLNSVGQGIGVIAENLGVLDADKFEKVATTAATYHKNTAGLPPLQAPNTASDSAASSKSDDDKWDKISTMIGERVGEQVASALSSGQFKFEFQSATGGVITIEPN